MEYDSSVVIVFCVMTFILGMLICMLIYEFGVIGIDNRGMKNPSINMDNFGVKMCEEHNLTYDRYEMTKDRIPKIFCKKENKIEDGYLVLLN